MEFLDWYIYVIVFVSGIICGTLNTLAGGGSLVTLPVLMLFMLPFIFLQPEKWLRKKVVAMPATRWWLYPVYFALGIYAGFLQAGIGYFLLIALVLGTGYDLLTANSLKVFVVLFISVAALSVFFLFSHKVQIHYDIGLVQALGQALGAFLGVKFAIAWNPKIIRWLLIAVMAAFSLKLLLF
jgi:uncharacterized membrane protein YfcA